MKKDNGKTFADLTLKRQESFTTVFYFNKHCCNVQEHNVLVINYRYPINTIVGQSTTVEIKIKTFFCRFCLILPLEVTLTTACRF